jgi:hypothetical protein
MPIVSEPGPDVLRVRTAIVDLKQSRPVLSGISSVTPVGVGINILRKGAADSWTGSGATTAEMIVLDSMTNEVLGAGEDNMSAGLTERFSEWGSVEEAFDFWGERLAKRLILQCRNVRMPIIWGLGFFFATNQRNRLIGMVQHVLKFDHVIMLRHIALRPQPESGLDNICSGIQAYLNPPFVR